MNILLDYFFPITSIEPTPDASTAFLKQVCLVVKPADAVTTGIITACTTNAEVAALTDNEDAAQLFSAGMGRVYILPMDDLDLATALEGQNQFFTLLISSDFVQAEIESTESVTGVQSSVKIGDITFTAVAAGTDGDDIDITLTTGATAGQEWVHVTALSINIHMSNGVSTAAQIVAAFNDSVAATALATAVADIGDEAVAQASATVQGLTGGVDAETGDADGLDVGTFKGVTGLSADDETFLTAQAAIANRCAFYADGDNGAENMCYAFGKMLANGLSWLNQQYITMPNADDVETIGDAETLFDARISFVISDAEFGERLALFAAGGKAIVAPYIKKNLELDFQSAALAYISGNQPAYTKKNAALLEDELDKVLKGYVESQQIESGTCQVLLEQDNFVASGYMNIAEPRALWRVFGEMRQTL